MPELELSGLRTTPLGGYLSGVGLLRAVSRTLDDEAAGCWRRQRFVLHSTAETVADLTAALSARFRPEAIVSPWNGGSGFTEGNKAHRSAEAAVGWVRESTGERWATVRAAVLAADRVAAAGRARGWGGTGNELWAKESKQSVLALCRAEFPDAALPWLDAAVALGADGETAFSRLLGTGGNFGRQELSVTYLTRARAALTDDRGTAWLTGLLTGDETVPYLRGPVGQFDPGRAGGIQSSPWEKRDEDGFVNPWAFLLTIEGTLLFTSAMVRRHGAGYAHAVLPFQVSSTTGTYDSAAVGEQVRSEIWTPEWSTPLRLAEVQHLMNEGRADWRHRPARSGLDFVRAIGSLGVDRGIDAFQRHIVVDRLGQNPLAVPVERVAVTERGSIRLLAGLDHWLDRLRRTTLPAQVALRVRGLEQALYRHASSGSDSDLVEVFGAVGRAQEAVARSGIVRRTVPPLVLPAGAALVEELLRPVDHDIELRLALALATARDRATPARTLSGLRPFLAPVRPVGRRVDWTAAPTLCPLSSGLSQALAEAARRRAFPGVTVDDEQPAVRGVRIAFGRGLLPRSADIRAFAFAEVDDRRVADLLAGLLVVDWHDVPDRRLPGGDSAEPALDLLLPFGAGRAVRLSPSEPPASVVVRPGSEWPARLAAGDTRGVLVDASRRLRIGGLRQVINAAASPLDGRRLAACLLLRASRSDMLAALGRVAVLPDIPHGQEISV